MCLLGKVERPRVSWGVLGCPGVIKLLFPYTFCTVALRHNPPTRIPREGVLQYRKKIFCTSPFCVAYTWGIAFNRLA